MATFGKVAVLMGGRSAEREISLLSGKAVLASLHRQGIDVEGIDVGDDILSQLMSSDCDRVFIVLHGRGGEDGEIQGTLNTLNLPYTGSSVTGAVLSMNKALSKQIWQQAGLPTADFVHVQSNDDMSMIVDKLGLPLFVKPVNEGSSIGMSKVQKADELAAAIRLAGQYDQEIIAERWIDGEEYTVAIVGDEALPVIRLSTPNDFYDFDAKYEANTTEYLCPAGLSDEDEQRCKALALQAFRALRMTGWGRIDLMRDKQGQFYLLEANSVPGMTDHSLVPMAAKQAGKSFDQLTREILSSTIQEAL